MHLFSYVITHDSGFAPNPFGGFLTLATCKPRIRRRARRGDYIVGTGSSAGVGRHKLVFAAQVFEIVPLSDYGRLQRFAAKRPSTKNPWWLKHGDNIYLIANGKWKQRPNMHHGPEATDHDTSGENALICNRFWYFGADAIDIPLDLRQIIKKGPGHKRITDESLVDAFIEWIAAQPKGLRGMPEMENEQRASRCERNRLRTSVGEC